VGGGAVAELSRSCGRCGTELRSGARFCTKCGQRVIDETAAAEAPEEVGVPGAVPFPGPDSPPRNEWSDWYQPTAYQQPPMPYPGYQQSYRPPFEPTPGGPAGAPGPAGPPRGPGDGARRSRAPLFWSVLSAVAAVAVVAIVLLLHPFSHQQTVNDAANSAKNAPPTTSVTASSPTASASASLTPSASASASASRSVSSTAVTEQQSASTVGGMLASSVTDRTAINDAYDDVYGCGPNLHGDAAVFTRAASSRRALLARLATMPGRAALPPALLTDLTDAWQASTTADTGFAQWADDEVTQGCVAGDTNDPGYRTTITPDNEATEYKTDFTTEWNPIAARYGLTTYQQGQL
jgi:zinc-ribbon domain